jgi:hypothetical protein
MREIGDGELLWLWAVVAPGIQLTAARGGGVAGRGACQRGGAPILGVGVEGISPERHLHDGTVEAEGLIGEGPGKCSSTVMEGSASSVGRRGSSGTRGRVQKAARCGWCRWGHHDRGELVADAWTVGHQHQFGVCRGARQGWAL